ncbi:MAG: hypothetical protein QF664_05565 [Dehalococcoidia bacterium]|nr:hypothetical protein [Dehalococcoidia bacterium]
MTDKRRRADGLLPLGLPVPVRVQVDAAGLPSTVTLGGQQGGAPLAVEQVDEAWRIAEEWWRETPLGRTYYRVIVDGGRPLMLFHDDLAASSPAGTGTAGANLEGDWYEQRY